MLMVLHGNDGVHTHNRGSKDILGAITHYTPVMTIKYGTALKSKTFFVNPSIEASNCSKIVFFRGVHVFWPSFIKQYMLNSA